MSSSAAPPHQPSSWSACTALFWRQAGVAEQEATEPQDELSRAQSAARRSAPTAETAAPASARGGGGVRQHRRRLRARRAEGNGAHLGEELCEGGLELVDRDDCLITGTLVQHLQVERVQQRDGRLSVRRVDDLWLLLLRRGDGEEGAQPRAREPLRDGISLPSSESTRDAPPTRASGCRGRGRRGDRGVLEQLLVARIAHEPFDLRVPLGLADDLLVVSASSRRRRAAAPPRGGPPRRCR